MAAVTPGLEDFTGYLLRLAYVRAQRFAAALFPDGPHPREFAVLTALAATGPLSQQRLAQRLRVNRTLMVKVADDLERRGFVERRRDPADRRAYALHVTPAGTAAGDRLRTEIAGADRAMTEPLDARERERLNALLERLISSDPGRVVPPGLATTTGYLVAHAHFMTRDRANELLRPVGIVVRHFGLMSLLDAHGPSAQQALARGLSVSATMITQIVDDMQALGLVERRRNPDDRRSYLVTLTPTGAAKLAAAREVQEVLRAEIAAAIGADGDRELQALLRKLVGV